VRSYFAAVTIGGLRKRINHVCRCLAVGSHECIPHTLYAKLDVVGPGALGESIAKVFAAMAAGDEPDAEGIDLLIRSLAAAMPNLRLRPAERCCEWEWAATTDSLDRMLWPIVRSAADLVTSEEVGRVRECASETCAWLFLDGSRNQRRKWCDMATCGNRAKARNYYRRQRAEQPAEDDA
jgi:predicted RNA-binding Zn ribbon-like protein